MEAADRRRKAVLLGASGFIGTNLAPALAARGYDIVAFSRTDMGRLPGNCTTVCGDLTAPPARLLELMEGALVFHLISTTRPRNGTSNAAGELADNVGATLNLLEKTQDSGCRWIFASSGGTVYGQPLTKPITEDHPTKPISSYGIAKLAIEKYFELYRVVHGTDYVVARIANPYGPFQSAATGQGLVATLFDRIAKGTPIEIWGDGENVRDYIYIDDVVKALIVIAEDAPSGQIYNVGSGKGISINEMLRNISEVLNKSPKVTKTAARGIDVRFNELDIGKIARELGWYPEIDAKLGLKLTRDWLRQKSET